MRLRELVDLADMPGGMRELEADALAVPAGRKAPALDRRHLVRHAGMRRVVVMVVMPDCGTISPGLYSCATVVLRSNLSTICQTEFNQPAFLRQPEAEAPGCAQSPYGFAQHGHRR